MYGPFVLIEKSGKRERAERVFIGDVKGKDEAWLRDTLFDNPEIIPAANFALMLAQSMPSSLTSADV